MLAVAARGYIGDMATSLAHLSRPLLPARHERGGSLAALCTLLALSLINAGGCAFTRQQQLEARAETINGKLVAERSRVLALPAADAERPVRIDHLTNLKLTLSAANIALGSVPRVVPEDQRPLAYDILQEVYGTIDWNIPLGPGDAKKPLPAGWVGNSLQLAPTTQPRSTTPGINQ